MEDETSSPELTDPQSYVQILTLQGYGVTHFSGYCSPSNGFLGVINSLVLLEKERRLLCFTLIGIEKEIDKLILMKF